MYQKPGPMESEVQAFLISLSSQSTYSRSTRQAYENDLRRFIAHLKNILKRTPTLEDFNGKLVNLYLEMERKLGRRPSTLLRRRATLRTFEKFLIKEGYRQPPSILDNTPDHLQTSPLTCLSLAQIEELHSAIDKSQRTLARRDDAILTLLLETGLSVSKLVSLNLSDLDLKTGKLHILFDNKEDFWLPIGKAARPVDRYLREGRPELGAGPDETALFISQVGSRMTRQTVWQVLRHWGEAAKLPFTLSPRLIRHTAALHMARSGRQVSEIQILLGHSNPLSTQALMERLEKSNKETM